MNTALVHTPPTSVQHVRLPWSPAASPVHRYLAKLAAGSRPTQRSALKTVADILVPGASPHDIPWHALTVTTASALTIRLRENRAPRTANRMLAAVRGVLDVCRKERWLIVPADPGGYSMSQSEWFELLTDELASKNVLTRGPGRLVADAEIQALHTAAGTDARGLRDSAALALGFGAGMRIAEIAALDVHSLAPDGRIHVRMGKGAKDRTTALPPASLRVVLKWLQVRGDADGPLLTRLLGRRRFPVAMARVSAHSLWQALRDLGDAAGVKFTPHDMRRTCATRLIRAGVSLKTVKDMLGHADIETTATYDMTSEDAMVAAVQAVDTPLNDGG